MVMGTRCHQLAMYVVYESPLMMVSDSPEAYRGAMGTDFIRQVPTSWDETRVLAGEVAEYVVIARRLGKDWYIGAMTNWTPRHLSIPLKRWEMALGKPMSTTTALMRHTLLRTSLTRR